MMTTHAWSLLATTPWWVFALYVYGLKLAYQSAKTRAIHFKYLLITLLFYLVSFSPILLITKPTGEQILWLVGATAISAVLGFSFSVIKQIKLNADQTQIILPGSAWAVGTNALIVSLIFFGYLNSQWISQIWEDQLPFWYCFIFALGLGLMLGQLTRVLMLRRKVSR